jgi:hypothetical protein
MRSVEYGLIDRNPVENVRIQRAKTGKKRIKPHVTPETASRISACIPHSPVWNSSGSSSFTKKWLN